jgi:hypothetical protein
MQEEACLLVGARDRTHACMFWDRQHSTCSPSRCAMPRVHFEQTWCKEGLSVGIQTTPGDAGGVPYPRARTTRTRFSLNF